MARSSKLSKAQKALIARMRNDLRGEIIRGRFGCYFACDRDKWRGKYLDDRTVIILFEKGFIYKPKHNSVYRLTDLGKTIEI